MHQMPGGEHSVSAFQALNKMPVLTGAVVGAAVLSTANLALKLQAETIKLGFFWPATGVLLAAVLLTRGKHQIASLAGAAVAYVISGWIYDRAAAATLVFVLANLAEAIGIAYVVERGTQQRFRLDSLIAVGWFVAAAIVVIALVGLAVACSLTAIGHSTAPIREVWQVWFLSDLTGALTICPWIILIGDEVRATGSGTPRESFINVALVALAAYILVSQGDATPTALSFTIVILFPLIVWISARSSFATAALGLLAIALIVVWHTSHGVGLFATNVTAAQAFLIAVAFSVLTLGAILHEHRIALVAARRGALMLAQSERHQRQALAAAQAGTFEWNIASGRVTWSPEHYAILGIDPAAGPPSYKSWSERIHPDDRERVESEAQRVTREGRYQDLTTEYRIVRASDGTVRWVRSMARVEPNASGQIERISGLMIDMTERRGTEAQRDHALQDLSASEERYRATFDSAPIGISHVGLDGRWLRFNDEICRITGYSRAELLEMTFADVTHPEDIAADWEKAERLVSGDLSNYTMEKRYVRKDGSAIWVNLSVSLLRDSNAKPVNFISVIEDIDARKKAEAELRESTLRLRIALDSAKAGIHVWHVKTDEFEWDDTVRAHWGMPAGVPATRQVFLSGIHPNDRLLAQEALTRALDVAGDGNYFAEYRVRGADGNERWISATGKVEFQNGEPARLIGTTRDITERKDREQHIRVLMGEVSHRSKNLLAVAQVIARQTASSVDTVGEFEKRFSARLRSLATSQDLLVAQEWRGVTLLTLIRTQLGHYVDLVDTRITIEACDVVVTPSASQSIGMAIHELSTNAAKYGALSNDTGTVTIGCRIEKSATGPEMIISWQEQGGPPVMPPTRSGFGRMVIERMLTQRLDGTVSLVYSTEGLRWRFEVPVANIAVEASSDRPPQKPERLAS